MPLRVLTVTLLIRIVERMASRIASIQMFLYGLFPVLLPPKELTRLMGAYYLRSYEHLGNTFDADLHQWTLEHWEEGAVSTHMAVPGTVLVLGAGLGRESLILAQRGHRVIGVDTNGTGLQIAARRAVQQQVDVLFVQADFHRLPLLHADYVFLSGVMYSAIPGRALRQACVRQFREITAHHGTVILNFLRSQELQTGTHRALQRLNRWLVKLPGANLAYQLGDTCSHGHFMHAFLDEAELRSELTESGATILQLNWTQGYVVLS